MVASQVGAEAARRQELAARYKDELQKALSEDQEIGVLLRQTEGEIERNSGRRDQSSQRVREMEANLDQYSRQEIGSVYADAHAAELRVFVMRSQLELLQAKRESLDRLIRPLQDLNALLERPAEPAAAAKPSTPAAVSRSAALSIIQAQEDERQRLARQMHDGPAQSLTNLILQAEICERFMAADPVRGKAELASLRTMVNGTFHGVRDLIFDLRPMILDDLGLIPTLRRHVQSYEEKRRIPTTLTVSGRERRLPQPVEVALFRAIQESLNNVAEHSRANHAHVTLDLRDETMAHAAVEDNGCGFNAVSVLQSARERRTLGVAGILDRVEALGGTVTLDSTPGRGTRVLVDVPLTS